MRLSLYLAIFNMLPVPPLDGSKLLLAARIPAVIYQEIARAGFMILIVLMSFTNVGLYMSVWAYDGARRFSGSCGSGLLPGRLRLRQRSIGAVARESQQRAGDRADSNHQPG